VVLQSTIQAEVIVDTMLVLITIQFTISAQFVERSTCGVDRDCDLTIENNDLGGFREFQESAVCGGFVVDWRYNRAELCKEAEY